MDNLIINILKIFHQIIINTKVAVNKVRSIKMQNQLVQSIIYILYII